MFGFMKSPANKPPKQKSIDSSNPFESDTESENKNTITPARRTSSEPILVTPDFKSNNFDDDDDDDYFGRGPPSKNKQKKDLETMSVQELEGYAVNQAEDTTKSVNNCVKIAEDIRQDATRTLDVLHQQGEQIHRTHEMAVDMDLDLSRVQLTANLVFKFCGKEYQLYVMTHDRTTPRSLCMQIETCTFFKDEICEFDFQINNLMSN